MIQRKISPKKTQREESWALRDEFLKADMNRLDNLNYFQLDFACPDLDTFFLSLNSKKKIKESKAMVNEFYNRMIDQEKLTKKSLYVRLKWIIYQHHLLSKFEENSPLYEYVLKAFQFYQEYLDEIGQKLKGYQGYLMKVLVRPYIQYLIKYCMLKIPQQDDSIEPAPTQKIDAGKSVSQTQRGSSKKDRDQKEKKLVEENTTNESKNKNIFMLHKIRNDSETVSSSEDSTVGDRDEKAQNYKISEKLVKWYTIFNFILSAVEKFHQPLLEVKNYFGEEFPFLGKLAQLVINDLNAQTFKLKYLYRNLRSLKKCEVTLIELQGLESKLKNFQRNHKNIPNSVANNIQVDFSNEQIRDFMCSPLKKMSLLSPITKKSKIQ